MMSVTVMTRIHAGDCAYAGSADHNEEALANMLKCAAYS